MKKAELSRSPSMMHRQREDTGEIIQSVYQEFVRIVCRRKVFWYSQKTAGGGVIPNEDEDVRVNARKRSTNGMRGKLGMRWKLELPEDGQRWQIKHWRRRRSRRDTTHKHCVVAVG